MSEAHRRKKQPDHVRAQLVACATELALAKGLGAVSVDAVASAAEVTKGGLFHHFASKQALVDAVFAHLIDEFDQALQARMAGDPVAYGRFTRAYLALSTDNAEEDASARALWISSMSDPRLCAVWGDWLTAQLVIHAETDGGTALEAVRFAADGIWFGRFSGLSPRDPAALRDRLLQLTLPPT